MITSGFAQTDAFAYDDTARCTLLCALAAQRLGEAYVRYRCDCIRLTIDLHEATGAIEPIDRTTLPDYSEEWSKHNDKSILDDWLYRLGYIAFGAAGEIEPTDKAMIVIDSRSLQCGDIAVFRPWRCNHHLATMLDSERAVHVIKPSRFYEGQVCQIDLFAVQRFGPHRWYWADKFSYAIRLHAPWD